jgi:uncharacterized membrane protein YccF (DUF307 family)
MNWVYFTLIGWWAALIWAFVALCMCATIILWPVGATMFFKTPEIAFGES